MQVDEISDCKEFLLVIGVVQALHGHCSEGDGVLDVDSDCVSCGCEGFVICWWRRCCKEIHGFAQSKSIYNFVCVRDFRGPVGQAQRLP